MGDITYVRLKGHFIYVCLLMDVFTRMIRGWHISQQLTQSLTLKPLETALGQSVPDEVVYGTRRVLTGFKILSRMPLERFLGAFPVV